MTTLVPLSQFAQNPGKIDLLIVGAGPSGLAVAQEMSGQGLNIVVLESAGLIETPETAELCRVDHDGDLRSPAPLAKRQEFHAESTVHWDPDVQRYGVRCRVIGGSTIAWAGKSATFDETDFAERPWVPLSGWPISRPELMPYLDRAADILNLGPNVYDEKFWDVAGRKAPEPKINESRLKPFFWQFARSRVDPMDIYRSGPEFLEEQRNDVTIVTDATAQKILTDPTGRFVRGVSVANIAGQVFELHADTCVIAASAVENARLLLLSNDAKPAGLGNDTDQVGRYLMDHPGAHVASFPEKDLKPIKKRFSFYGLSHNGRTLMYMPGLSMAPELQREEEQLNCAVYFMMERAEDNPFDALKRLLKRQSDRPLADIKNIIANAGIVGAGVAQKALQSGIVPRKVKQMVSNAAILISPNFVVEEFETRGIPHKLTGVAIHAITEQPPRAENRVTLSDQTDRFGNPLPRVEWEIGAAPRRALAGIARLVADELEASGLPRPQLADWVQNDRPEDAVIIDMAHTLGTTRMSLDPATGVVDQNCQVYGTEGLYVAGGSVFPTSGHANPTLMMMGIAVRLADHLKEKANQKPAAAA
jgi:choline dehydrogenase-like flavoprotein